MTNQAEQFVADIDKWEAVAGQSLLYAHFSDGSALQISTDANRKRLGTNDPPGTVANRFGASLVPKTGFRIEIDKLVFTFRDGSGLEVGLDGTTLYMP